MATQHYPPPQGGNMMNPQHPQHTDFQQHQQMYMQPQQPPQYPAAAAGGGLDQQMNMMNLGPSKQPQQHPPSQQPANFAPPQPQQTNHQIPSMDGQPHQHQPGQTNGYHHHQHSPSPQFSTAPPQTQQTAFNQLPPQPQYMQAHQQPAGYPQPPQPGFQPQQPQYQPRPGFAPQPGAGGWPQQQQFQQPAAARRLNADDMPGPIDTINDDRERWAHQGNVFRTGQREHRMPPLVTTDDVSIEDTGNADPLFIRSVSYTLPATSEMTKQSHQPMALSIAPMADVGRQMYTVDMNELGPVRCGRCKAYMSPNMRFLDGGRRFECRLCNVISDCPEQYFCHLDYNGVRSDKRERAELCLGSYEFVATKDYCRDQKFPVAPAFIFMIEVTHHTVQSGLLHLLCQNMKSYILENLPTENGASESEIRIGFATYNSVIQFYNLSPALSQPQVMVVADVQEMFAPVADGFLVKWREAEHLVDALLDQIPKMFAGTQEAEVVFGPVIEAGMDALRQSERSGKLFIFHSSLPTKVAPGSLANRDDRKLIGSEKEKALFLPQAKYYTELGEKCVQVGCGVELFLFPSQYLDVASMSEVPRITSGGLHKYDYFTADVQGEAFLIDLYNVVSRPIAFDAVMRVRTSAGIRAVDFNGNFLMTNTTDVELASIDSKKSIAVEIKHDDKLSEEAGAFVQVALLYTSMSGQRKIRIHNLNLDVANKHGDVFKTADLDTLMNLTAKKAISVLLSDSAKSMREKVTKQCSQILACYRKNCATPSTAGQLVLPENLKLLPLYVNCLMKNEAFNAGNDLSTDSRAFYLFTLNSMSVEDSQVYLYPRLFELPTEPMEDISLPRQMRCSLERLEPTKWYLAENGLCIYIWIGMAISGEVLQSVFNVNNATHIQPNTPIPSLANPLNKTISGIIQLIRIQRNSHLKTLIVRQHQQPDAIEAMFRRYMVEDKTCGDAYVDFLCHVHKEIRELLD